MWSDAAYRFPHRVAMSILVVTTCLHTGMPSPNLHREVSFAIAILGTLVGMAISYAFESRARESYLQEKALRDTMVRAPAD